MIEEAIINKLRNTSAITALAGQRSYAIVAPEGVANPFIVVTRVGSQRELAHDGPTGITSAFLQISCISDKPGSAKKLADTVRSELHGFRGIVGGVSVNYLEVINDVDIPDPDYGFQVAVDIEVSFKET
jgi:hypothetical protein